MIKNNGTILGKRGFPLKPWVINSGYLQVEYCGKKQLVHRLVAMAFIPNPDNLPEVNHKDGNKHNNHFTNLEWCTASNNKQHAHDTGLRDDARAVVATDPKTQEEMLFKSISAAARYFNISTGNICNTLKGKFKTCNKLYWRYA